MQTSTEPAAVLDGRQAWLRLAIALALSTVGGIGLWSSVIVLPTIQAEFGVDRSGASLPYTATLIGFAIGGVLMGRLADRIGIVRPLLIGGLMLGVGYTIAGSASSYGQFVLAQALLIGLCGSSVFFGPLVADISLWFAKRRGIAVATVASGNYLAGALWPPVLQFGMDTVGWRLTHIGVGIICVVLIVPLALRLKGRPAADPSAAAAVAARQTRLAVPPQLLAALLMLASIACCVAMSMPQVHIVAYCVDLGYGPAVGAEMLSLMLGLGVISRLLFGAIADRIGGVPTLILGSLAQGVTLLFYLPFDGLLSLYLISAMFGLAQGGIVPCYALIVREYFPASQAGTLVSAVLMTTVIGMALGGWLSGEIFDLTGSYQAAFWNGIAWNLLNMSIALWLLFGRRRTGKPGPDELKTDTSTGVAGVRVGSGA